MKKKLLFIYNPHAGKSKIKNWLSSIIELFVKSNYEVIIYSTACKKDANKIVIDCLSRDQYDLVVCSGGDGTLNEVISGVMQTGNHTKIGYIPSGTTNDFAYNLNLPKNMPKAATVALNGEEFPCDVGAINGEYFTYTAAFGLFTETSYETPQTTKNILGRLAYVLEGVKRLPNWKSYHMEITIGDRMINDHFIYGMVANSNSVGGFKGLAGKDVLLDDGLFEGLFIKKPQNVLDLQGIINDLLKGNLNSDHIISFPVKELHLKSEESVPWCIDGEFGGEYQETTIVNIKQAVTIIRNSEESKLLIKV
ncbi:MAG: diacylglycerol kinase catalytic region [Anaerocolumna sp.]|jgi:YegS/Rv2252/BmrU family lipid kinase|nr:diacylglycerol kinase catalytic region [Anaerocolumna sp.]